MVIRHILISETFKGGATWNSRSMLPYLPPYKTYFLCIMSPPPPIPSHLIFPLSRWLVVKASALGFPKWFPLQLCCTYIWACLVHIDQKQYLGFWPEEWGCPSLDTCHKHFGSVSFLWDHNYLSRERVLKSLSRKSHFLLSRAEHYTVMLPEHGHWILLVSWVQYPPGNRTLIRQFHVDLTTPYRYNNFVGCGTQIAQMVSKGNVVFCSLCSGIIFMHNIKMQCQFLKPTYLITHKAML